MPGQPAGLMRVLTLQNLCRDVTSAACCFMILSALCRVSHNRLSCIKECSQKRFAAALDARCHMPDSRSFLSALAYNVESVTA